MASVMITLTGICAGGEHLTFDVSGAASGTVPGSRDEMLRPISDEDKVAFIKVLTKLVRIGRTNAQARALLEAGVEVTV